MTASDHSMCVGCWDARYPGRHPYRMLYSPVASCCWCGVDTDGGIFVRATPPANCGGHR